VGSKSVVQVKRRHICRLNNYDNRLGGPDGSPSRVYEFVVVDIRLVGGAVPNEGRLEVKFAGLWGTVCDDAFDDVDAGVACSMLNYGYAHDTSLWPAAAPAGNIYLQT